MNHAQQEKAVDGNSANTQKAVARIDELTKESRDLAERLTGRLESIMYAPEACEECSNNPPFNGCTLSMNIDGMADHLEDTNKMYRRILDHCDL